MSQTESLFGSSLTQQSVDLRVIQLRHRLATGAYKELPGMTAVGRRTADEGVARLETVHEPFGDEEIKGAIDRRGGNRALRAGEGLNEVVRFRRPVTLPDELEYPPTLGGEPDSALAAELLGTRQRIGQAVAVIMVGGGKWRYLR